MAPRAGFEPTTNRLTADCSTAELPRNHYYDTKKKIRCLVLKTKISIFLINFF